MGGWKLEVFKMTMYMMFPVGCFWIFNQPRFYEKMVENNRGALSARGDPKNKLELDEAIRQANLDRQAQLDAELVQSLKLSR